MQAISVSQIDILVSKFLNLTQVNLVSFSCDLLLLKELKNLQVLRLQSGHFSHVKAVLLVSGWHLLVLELVRLIGVDVKVIGKKCSSLKNLTLRGYNTLILENGGYSESLPGFSSLHHLAIYTKSDSSLMMYILLHSFNVSHVSIVAKGTSDLNIENVFRRNQLRFLEELHLELHGGQMPMSAARMIIGSCIQLMVLKGITTWGINSYALQNFLHEMKQAYPGVHIL
jgi:hypothetical protein